jgi:predicted P-loop ATPase
MRRSATAEFEIGGPGKRNQAAAGPPATAVFRGNYAGGSGVFSFVLFEGERHEADYRGAFRTGELSDDLCARLRGEFLARFGFDPRKEHIIDAVHGLCVENPVHPVRAYLDGLKWDGIPRVSYLLPAYFGAEDTALHRAFAEKVMTAAVRRVREPGAKFDTILVLEGPQGSGKSQGVEILASTEYHSDQEILAMDTKAQAEALEGVWIFEICELQGIGKADTHIAKA